MQEAVVEDDGGEEAPDLEVLSDVVGKLGLEKMQGTDPFLLIAILVSHDCPIDDLSQDEHAGADRDEGHCD